MHLVFLSVDRLVASLPFLSLPTCIVNDNQPFLVSEQLSPVHDFFSTSILNPPLGGLSLSFLVPLTFLVSFSLQNFNATPPLISHE